MIDLPLSAVLGLEAASDKHNVITSERVDASRKWLAQVASEMPELRPLDLAPGMVRELARALASPVSEIAVNLWNQSSEIRKYADTSRYPSTEAHEVELYEHELKQTVRLTVEVRVNNTRIGSMALTATASITLNGAKLVIRGGYITHVRLGDLTGRAVLSVERPVVLADLKLKEVKPDSWRLDQELKLPGNGVRITAGQPSREG